MSQFRKILVTGGSGSLGSRLLLSLVNNGYQVTGVGRQNIPAILQSKCDWMSLDLTAERKIDLDVEVLIHCAPLWLLPGVLTNLVRKDAVKRCIAMSSTSVIAKVNADDEGDRNLAVKLHDAEEKVKQLAFESINTTILRPTLIYGYGEDKNISVIASFIKRFGFFPVAGKADGLRQPVHVDDLITAIEQIIENPLTYGKTYNLTGAQTMPYREMLEQIFSSLGKPARILTLPLPIYRGLLAIRKSDYSPGSANRMNQNLSYDTQPARLDFGYQPQEFLQHPDKDLF